MIILAIVTKELSKKLDIALCLQRSVVGVRFLFTENEFNSSLVNTTKGKMSYCTMVRKATLGYSTKANKDNFSCLGGARALGIIELDDNFKSGRNYYNMGIYKDLTVSKTLVANMAFCKQRIYGIEVMPLENCTNDPDVILMVMNPHQAMRVMQGYAYVYGGDFHIKTTGNQAICSECTAYPFEFNSINASFMCTGTRYNARWDDSELMVGIPFNQLTSLVEGIYSTINLMELDDKKHIIEKNLKQEKIDFKIGYKCNYFMKNGK